MAHKIKGTITQFLDVISGEKKDGSGTWKKQSYLVKTDEEYNNLYCFEVFGEDKVDNLTKYQKVGDSVEVSFNVSTNEYNGKYYTSLSSWRIEKLEPQQQAPAPAGINQVTDNEPDDLPF